MFNFTQKGYAAPPFLWTQARRPLQAPIQADDLFVALMIKRKRNTVKMPYKSLKSPAKRLESLSSP
jgi:hypothetical protein